MTRVSNKYAVKIKVNKGNLNGLRELFPKCSENLKRLEKILESDSQNITKEKDRNKYYISMQSAGGLYNFREGGIGVNVYFLTPKAKKCFPEVKEIGYERLKEIKKSKPERMDFIKGLVSELKRE